MIPRFSHRSGRRSIRLRQQIHFIAATTNCKSISCRLVSLLLTYALLLQLPPQATPVAAPKLFKSSHQITSTEKTNREFNWSSVEASAGGWSEAISAMPGGTDVSPSTRSDAVVSRHKPTLNSGRIEGTLRLLQGESFTINGSTQLTSDLYLPGTPLIQVSKGAQLGGTVSEGGAANPANYTVSLTGGVILPGQIHTNVDAVPLPSDFPNSVPAPTGTRTVTIDSQSDVAAIGNWQTVRDLNVTGSHLSLDVPPGNYRTFTVNGNSQLNFTAGVYNFANTFNLDGSAKLRATGSVTINVAQNLTVNSGALVLGSYTSPGDVRLNVLGSFLNVNGSSQVSGLIRAYNGTVTLNGSSQLRGQVIANSLILNGGKIIGAVWPFQSGNALTVFGPRRFDRSTGPPNQYLEQFALPAGVTSPYTLHIQNGDSDGSSRISSATVKLNGVDVLKPDDLNQNIGSVDRTTVLTANNQLEVRLESVPGSYLIINIAGIVPGGDTTAPAIAITSPADHSSTTATHTDVSGTASDIGTGGTGASGVAHVYVNDAEAAYNSSEGTWSISNVTLALGANQLIARAVDQAGNEATASITVTRESPTNLAPTAAAGPDQTIALPQTASLQGTATDDGLPESSSLATTWSKGSGPGTVTFVESGALNTTASFSSAGTYVLRLTASDGSLSTSDELTITVQPENQPPTVNAGPDQTVALPQHATLNGSVSDDGLPEAGTLTITWTEVSGPSTVTFADASLAETTASFSLPGTYVLRLTASDTELTSNSDVTITVQPENHAPTVNAGPDQIISLLDTVQLNGAATDDAWPSGSSLSVSWNFISGPGPVEFDDPNSPSTIVRLASAGNYLLRLAASDGELSNSDEISITVTPPNQAPSVNAGLDQTIFLPNSAVDLNGTISDDALPLGSSVLTSWSKVSGPGSVLFANPNVTVTSATFSEAGTYVLRLTAGDSQLSSSDDVQITVIPENHAPTANAGADQTITLPSVANLNGVVSDDGLPAGSTLTSTWSKVSGPGTVTFANANSTLTSAAFSEAGTYVLRLAASDSELTSNDDVQVTVIAENHAPTVNAGADQSITLPNVANLSASFSDDGLPAGSTLTTAWSKLSGPGDVTFSSPNGALTSASFSVAGAYVLRLTANDSQLSTSDEVSVTVIPENHAPTANAGTDQQIILPNTASLNGSVSDDGLPAGSTLTSTWSKVSGPGTVTFANANVTVTTAEFSQPGNYILRLAASDSRLNSSDDVQVNVNPPNQAPTVNAGADQTITLPWIANLQGTATDDGAPAGSVLTLSWSMVSGPASVSFGNPQLPATTATFMQAGTYTLRLTVSDSEFTRFDDVTVVADTKFCAAMPTGIISWWPGDNNANDLVNGHHGLLRGGATFANAVVNQGFKLDGVDDYVEIPDSADLKPANVTVDAWVKFDSLNSQVISASQGQQYIVFKKNTRSGAFEGYTLYKFRQNGVDKIGFAVASSAGVQASVTSQTSVVAGQFYHVAGTYDRNRVKLYVNGVLEAEQPATFALDYGTRPVFLGTTGETNWDGKLNGVIDEADVFNRALSASEIQEIYLAGSAGKCKTPVNHPPKANAGTDQTTKLAAPANLQGSVTDDGLPGNILTSSWSKVNGPGNVVFANAGAAATTASFDATGVYVLRLTASDSQLSASDDVTVTVANNQPPIADFTLPGSGAPVSLTLSSYSSYNGRLDNHPTKLLDSSSGTYWQAAAGHVTNEYFVFGTENGQPALVDRVIVQPWYASPSDANVRDFEVKVSATSNSDGAFQTVLTGTMPPNSNDLREFNFPGGTTSARFIKLVLKNNYGNASFMNLGNFDVALSGNADGIISLLGQPNAALNQSPALVPNGGAIYDFSYVGGSTMPDGLLGYSRNGWVTSNVQNQFAIIQLGGGKLCTLDGVKLATGYDAGYGYPNGVKDFEVWVSSTTPDNASFTRVLSATATLTPHLQTFNFPSHPVQARYVKYVPLNNFGGGAYIITATFDVIAEGTARVVAASGTLDNGATPPEQAFDGNDSTFWYGPNFAVNDVWVKTSLANEAVHKVYGVRISPLSSSIFGQHAPKDFDIRVSTSTTDESTFTTVYSGTLSGALNAGAQQFIFTQPVDAKYVEFYWKNSYSDSIIAVTELEVLAYPLQGSALIGYSSFDASYTSPTNALDIDTTNWSWVTAGGQNTNQWLKLVLPNGDLWTIDHVALMPGTLFNNPNAAPKDFEIQISTTDSADASFSTIFSGTLQNSVTLQHFYFSAVQARYVRLLLKNSYGSTQIALSQFLVYAPDRGSTDSHFIDRSIDPDGHIAAWSWNFGDGGTSTEQNPSHHYALPGTYTVTLTITDDDGLTASHQLLYRASAPLAAELAASPLIAHEGGENVRFTDVTRLLVQPNAYRVWNFGDSDTLTSAPAANNTHKFLDNGTFNVTMAVGENSGIRYTVTKTVTVLNVPPAVAVAPGKTVVWGEQWTNAPSMSDQSPIDSQTLRGVWNFGDGQNSVCLNCNNSLGTVTHSYALPGVYNASLTVTDKDGGAASATASYIVNKRPAALIFQTPPSQTNGSPLVIHAQLRDTFANLPLSGKPLQFTLNGVAFNTVTGIDGVAEVSVPLPAGTKIDIITGSFAEEEYYLSCGGVVVPATGGGTQPGASLSNRGTNFWLMFPQAYTDGFGPLTQKLFITSTVDTSGVVSIPVLNFTQNFTVSANTVATVQLPSVQVTESNIIQAKGIHVTAQLPVTVYGLNQRANSSDAFLALPVNSLGTDHFILTYSNGAFAPSSELGVVATENATTVTITPAVTTGNRIGGVPYNLTLNQGQTYLLQNTIPNTTGDLTGSRVTSGKPIAVFAGHMAATLPDEAICCADHLVEQLPPTNVWGKRFATVPLATRTKGDFFRFIASQDATAIYLNGSFTAVVNRGQWVERIIKDPTEIIATAPIMVAQYSTSSNYDMPTTGKADPFMMIIPPYSQFLNHYTITTPGTGFAINYANVVAPTASLGSITLDGTPIPPSSFMSIGVSGFSGAQVAITVGAHNFDGPASFGVFIYGYNSDEGYGYPAGMNLTATVQSTNIAVSPQASSHTINTQGCVVATVTDQDQNPLGGRTLNFIVSGANPANSSAVTDAAGHATLCYAGTNVGTDQVVARIGSTQTTASIIWTPPNQPPVVDAGADQTITLPAAANLKGSATDDGLPANTLSVSWSKVSGPGNVTFGNPNAATTTAAFDPPGVYVLRLTASDTALSASDDIQINVNPTPINQPPTANAGSDQSVTINGNLIANGSDEDQIVNGEIAGWTEVQGTTWTKGSANLATGLPNAQRGDSYFFAGDAPQAELRQDIDVSAFATNIAGGTQQFEFKAYLRSALEAAPDSARVVVEYRNAANTNVIATLDSGEITSTNAWQLTDDTRIAPLGTGWIRVRLIGMRNTGATNDAFFDSITLRPIGNAAVKLNGLASDDGLPYGSTLTSTWTAVSGPGVVTFGNTTSPLSGASFISPGTYVLRLTASDGQSSVSDDVTINVAPANQPPVVIADANQTVTLPASAALNGAVSDDGEPFGSSVSVLWTKVSGPGVVTFADSHQATTTASFSAAGNYVLRLTADDSEYEASADVTITVNPEVTQTNQPPVVNPGTSQTVAVPTDTVTLNGVVTDDGLPAGSTLLVSWTQVSGPGVVTFGNSNNAVTTAQFSAVGSYVLRLSASDGAYVVSADVGVTLAPQNYPPTANAGPDQTTLLSQPVQLNGSAGDDGLPAGSNLTTTWSTVSGPSAVTFDNPNMTITGAHFKATGTYILRLTASDGTLTASDELTITVIDNVAPPTVEITTPTDGSSVTEPTLVTGSVSGGAWVLEYSLASDDNANNRYWTTFANGNGAVTNSSLGTLDPTMLLNGLFDIRLSATDSYGQTSRTTQAVVVERNLKVGNFTVSFSDLNIPVAGVPIEVTRTYDSRDKRVGDFGFGWTLGLKNIRLEKARVIGLKWFETKSDEAFPNYCLESTGSHLVTVTFPGGKVFKFEASTAPKCQRFAPISGGTVVFTPLPGTNGTLEMVGSPDFQVNGSVPGPVDLVGIGGGVNIVNSSLFKFTAEDGTAFVIDQRNGLQSIQDTNNNTVTVSAGGIVHSSGGLQTKGITFNRDRLGRITSVTDPAGNVQTYNYDAAGDLVSYTDNENNTSTYSYDANHRLLTIHDPRGIQPIRNDYDADGRLISHTDAFGKVITYLHDLSGRSETITDRLGHSTIFEYDERGNVLTKTDARGGVTAFTYDDNDNVLSETNPLGKTTTYTYDANDHRTSVTDPLLNVTQFTYNGLGKLLTATDPLNQVTTNTYNGSGNLLTTKDALNNTTTFAYSPFDGQRILTTDALDNSTHYEYTNGYLTKETDALGHETKFGYDANGNRASQTVTRTNAGGQLETITTSYEYDKLNRLKKTSFADGSSMQVEYNSIGQQAATIDQLGHRTEFTYDDMGRLTKTAYVDGTFEEATYDAEGHRLTSKDRAGHVTSYTYDELGRVTKTTLADGTFTSTTYDHAGQVMAVAEARGNVTHYEYDDAGRRTKVRNALNQETTFAYDAGGNQLSITDALGHTTSYEYDLNNRRTKTVYADDSYDTVAYDALGRIAFKTDQAGKTTQFTYDSLGRLMRVKDALNQETVYTYDELGHQLSQTDANNHTTRFEYDQLGRRIKRILPGGQWETFSYDDGGSLHTRTDFNGHTTTCNYDLMRRLLAKVPDASLNQPTISFTYGPSGQRATMNDVSGTTTYSYDARNRLASKQTPFGTLSYAYDETGRLLTTRSSNAYGLSVDYSYDLLNRLVTVKDNNLLALNGGATTYNYDDVGNLESYSYPNGVTSTYGYNSLNRLTTMTVGTIGSSLASYSYTLGPAGNRRSVEESNGRKVNYTYDDLYRLTNETIANDSHGVNGSVGYSYDPVGNRLSRTSTLAPVSSQSSTYDANDRLNSDSYDNNGNTTTANGNSYAYDFENHLTSLNVTGATYVYDGDGNRVAKTVGGVTTNYLVDTNNPTGYAQVVDELQGGAVVKTFTYGHDLISQRCSPLTANCALSFYGYDGHGSVRLLTDAIGAVTDTYDYDAFGNLISRTGTTSNDNLYSGEQFDANLGFYYLRARYMNAMAGRFVSMDSYEGGSYDPASLHKYSYTRNSPANLNDPSGRFSLADTLNTSVLVGTISGFSIGFYTGGLEGAIRGAVQGATIGALIPLTGAGVGYALLGNAARGIFIVGWGVGLGNAGVSGFSFATATTGEERFEAGIGFVATVGFMFIGPRALQYANTRTIAAEELNAEFLRLRGGRGQPPWPAETQVTEITIFRSLKYVRVYTEGQTKPVGAWVMEASEIEGLSMSQIQQKFALPFTPTNITTAEVPAGSTIRIGLAGQNSFGPGGGMQVNIVE